MPTADAWSLLLGAVLGLVVSIAGLRIRRNWERFDADQAQCRSDLIELGRHAELARIAVRGARLRESTPALLPTTADTADQLLVQYAAVAETVFEFRSRTKRLQPGALRMACARFAMLLSRYHVGEAWPSVAEMNAATETLEELIVGALDRTDRAHAATFAVSGERLMCPPSPYSSRLPKMQS